MTDFVHLLPFVGWIKCGNEDVTGPFRTTERLVDTTCPRCLFEGDPIPRSRKTTFEVAHAEALSEDAARSSSCMTDDLFRYDAERLVYVNDETGVTIRHGYLAWSARRPRREGGYTLHRMRADQDHARADARGLIEVMREEIAAARASAHFEYVIQALGVGDATHVGTLRDQDNSVRIVEPAGQYQVIVAPQLNRETEAEFAERINRTVEPPDADHRAHLFVDSEAELFDCAYADGARDALRRLKRHSSGDIFTAMVEDVSRAMGVTL